MKKFSCLFLLFLSICTVCFAEEIPSVIIDAPAQNIPNAVVSDIVSAHPNASEIHIYAYKPATFDISNANSISPYGLFTYSYSNITKHCAQHHGRYRTDFLISVARGSERTLSAEYSFTSGITVNGSVTDGPDKSAPMPSAATLGFNVSSSVTCKISTSRKFSGPSEDSEYNSRSFYVAYYGNIGGWSCTATRNVPASTVQMSGQYIEPLEYAEYSVDNKISNK